ncbi:hypothetical protein ACFL50_01735 [Candidatus Latescibacterota bacterium]
MSLESVKKIMILYRIEPQSLNPSEYLSKQLLVYRNLSHLKRNISEVSDNLGYDFDKFHEEAAKRPSFYFPWKEQVRASR